MKRLKPGCNSNLVWVDGKPQLNVSIAAMQDMEQPVVGQTIRGTMSSGGRKLEGNAWYYGGDGDTPGVLKQGLPTRKSKKHCLIL